MSDRSRLARIRRRAYVILEGSDQHRGAGQWINLLLIYLILLNVAAVVLGTVPQIRERAGAFLVAFEYASVAVFTVEYLVRLWVATENSTYRHGFWGRVRYAVTPMALVDLLAILPSLLMMLSFDLRYLRILRLARLARVLKLGRYSHAMHVLGSVIQRKREELVISLTAVLGLLVFAASLMYFIEGAVQPEAFSSIPATMWWAVATLTTVGYGDVYPVTSLGKVFGAILSILCLGIFALPAGILAGGFTERLQQTGTRTRFCPHCGEPIHEP